MDPAIRRLKIHNLKAQLEVLRLQNIAFAKEYEASSTHEQKAEIAHRWDQVMKEMLSVKSELGLLERSGPESTMLN